MEPPELLRRLPARPRSSWTWTDYRAVSDRNLTVIPTDAGPPSSKRVLPISSPKGNTQDEAASHAIEHLLRVLDEHASLADYLASVPVEDEEITPEFARELERRRASKEAIPHDDILREFGLKK